jgi:hypothetical protein
MDPKIRRARFIFAPPTLIFIAPQNLYGRVPREREDRPYNPLVNLPPLIRPTLFYILPRFEEVV